MGPQANSNPEVPQKEIIGELEHSFFRTGAFRTAIELHLWEKIASGKDTAKKIADHDCVVISFSPAGFDATFAVCLGRIKKPALNRYRLSAGDNGISLYH